MLICVDLIYYEYVMYYEHSGPPYKNPPGGIFVGKPCKSRVLSARDKKSCICSLKFRLLLANKVTLTN